MTNYQICSDCHKAICKCPETVDIGDEVRGTHPDTLIYDDLSSDATLADIEVSEYGLSVDITHLMWNSDVYNAHSFLGRCPQGDNGCAFCTTAESDSTEEEDDEYCSHCDHCTEDDYE